MNKKGWIGTVIVIILILGCLWLFVIAPSNYFLKRYYFNRNIGSYCHLAYDASDIHQKIEYFDKCVDLMKTENFKGHCVWWFRKPNTNMQELYIVMNSLQLRMHDLELMQKDSFEYQKGLEQVEEEVEFFVRGNEGLSSTLSQFRRAYCFKHTWTKYLC